MEVLKVEAKEFKVYSQDIESLRMEKIWGTLLSQQFKAAKGRLEGQGGQSCENRLLE